MNVTRIGLDLAKNVFQVHGVDRDERVVIKRQLKRGQVLGYFEKLPPCRIGMEACAGAHCWARAFSRIGHEVKLIPPQFVKPYVKGQKNDANDAEAICEAAGRPSMRFVPAKTVAQQDLQAVHRIRGELVRQRTAKANQIRGLLAEYGLVVATRIDVLRRAFPDIQEDPDNGLSGLFRRRPPRRMKRRDGCKAFLASARSRPQPWWRRWVMAGNSSAGASLPPGSGSLPASTAVVARIGCWASANGATATCARCSSTARARSSGRRPTRPTRAAAGSARWRRGATRTWRRWRWPTRTRASPGLC